MNSKASTPEDYIADLPRDRQRAIVSLRTAIIENLPQGFSEVMSYGMIGYVVPHSIYPAGYHCDPRLPLPFINLASQKKHVAVYHMGLYHEPLLNWLATEWKKHSSLKFDCGKCCIRFKKIDEIPAGLIGELAAKMTPTEWIEIYEASRKR